MQGDLARGIMGWRIHFTAEDMARTRVASTLGPLAETMFGLWMIRRYGTKVRLSPWHERAVRNLTPEMRPLLALLPADALGVDLWSLTGEAATFEQGIDALMAMQPAHVRAELAYTCSFTHLPNTVWRIADNDGHGRQALARAARVSYRTLVEPHWTRISDQLQAARMSKGRLMLEGGLERLLTTLSPLVHWQPPVLELLVDEDADIYLSGRGLNLVPSLLLGERPMLLTDIVHQDQPPTLVFPAASDPAGMLEPAKRGGLATMLGRTRAAVLAALGEGATTAEVAQRVKLPAAHANHQLTLLRQAGLVATNRRDDQVLHSLTSLGEKFRDGA